MTDSGVHLDRRLTTCFPDAVTGMRGKLPTYLREGLSVNIQLHRLPVQSQDVWVWHISDGEQGIRELGTSDVAVLGTEGWQLLDPADDSFPFLALISQLGDALPVLLVDSSKIRTLARSDAIAFAEQHPVVLAFVYQDAEHPPLLPGPPAQLGELGLIFENNQVYTYQIALLEEEGALLCQRLRTALGTFLSTSPLIAEREGAWRDAQEMARTLTRKYWKVHQQVLLKEQPVDVQTIDLEPTSISARRLRSRQPSSLAIVQQEVAAVAISVDPITQALMRSLLDGRSYTLFPEERVAEHVPAGQGNLRIRIQPGSGEEWDSVLRSLKMLGDEVVDVFCALLAIAIETNGSAHMTDPFFLDVDDILKVCQRKQSHRAFTPLQRLRVVEHLRSLSRVHIMASTPGDGATAERAIGRARRKKRGDEETFKAIDSTVMDFLGTTIGEYYTLTGETLWERREVKIGRWALLAPSLSPQTAMLLKKVLGYHAQRQRHEKRIGRWLTLQFQTQSGHHAGAVVCNTRTLLEQSSIKPDLNKPGEMRQNIEDAIFQLAQDGVIGPYWRMVVLSKQPARAMKQRVDDQVATMVPGEEDKHVIRAQTSAEQHLLQQIWQRARGWWDLYEHDVWWLIKPPLSVQKTTQRLLQAASTQEASEER